MKNIVFGIMASIALVSCAASPNFTSLNDITPPTSDQDRTAKCHWISMEIKRVQDFKVQSGDSMQGLTAMAIANSPREIGALKSKATEIGCQ